jgi:plastocyanin
MTKQFLRSSIIVFILFLTGCNTAASANTQISAVISDNNYRPARWRVPAGATITLNLENKDAVPHAWVILYRQALSPYNQADEASIFWNTSIDAGKSVTVTFKAPAAAGNYPVIDPKFLGDGMQGTLTVVQISAIQDP